MQINMTKPKQLVDFWSTSKPRTFYQIPGLERITELLGGGFVKGSSHLLFAETGRGKTSLAIDMLYRWMMYTDYKVCFISLEEDMSEVQSRIAARILADTQNKYSFRDILAGKLPLNIKQDLNQIWKNWGESGKLDLVNISSVENNVNIADITAISEAIGSRIYDYDIFVIDHIHHVQMEGKDNPNIITSLLADKIKEKANNGATIFALAQMRKNENSRFNEDFGQRTYESIAGSSKNMQNAASITHLYYTEKQNANNSRAAEHKAYDSMQAVVRIEKSRYGRRGGAIVQFDPTNCHFSERLHDRQEYIDIHQPPENNKKLKYAQ